MVEIWHRFWNLRWWIKAPALGLVAIIVIAIIAAAVGGSDGEDDLTQEQRDLLAVVETVEAAGTASALPTDEPSATAAPTETSAPPLTSTPEPEPIVLEGFGQFATDPIVLPSAVSIATFTHDGSSNFVVTAFQGTERDLLVNEIGFYRGSRPLLGLTPVVLDIDADGPWTVTIEPIGLASSPAFGGAGSSVSGLFDPPGAAPWMIEHNGESNFVVWLHCASGSDLVQNEIGPVSGSTVVSFGAGPCFWEVEADGGWALNPR